MAVGVIALVFVAGWWMLNRDAAVGDDELRPLAAYRPPDMHALTVLPDDRDALLFGSHRGILVSRDGGRSWLPIGPSGDAMGIAMPPGSETAYAAGHDVFFRSEDAGRSWTEIRPELPGTDIHGLAASPLRPGIFYAHVVGHGLYRSDDAGQSWRPAGTLPGSTMALAVATAEGRDVLFAMTMEGVLRSADGAATWERIPELGGSYVSAAGAMVYAASGSTIYVSSDGGVRWERRAFPENAVLIAPAPTAPEIVYVVTRGHVVWRSTDGGATWERVG
ncbi:MAG: hypothetical protein ACRDM0_01635 [Thermoleophilaceae bacterium]